MCVIDKDKHLVLNKKLAMENEQILISYSKSLIVRPSVVIVDDLEYEGASLIINRKSEVSLTHSEMKKLYKLLKKTDISNLVSTASVLGFLISNSKDIQTSNYNDIRDIDDSFYNPPKSKNNIDILKSANMKGDNKRLWDED